MNNFGVVRVSRELPNRSAVGGIFVNRVGVGDAAPDDDTNQTYAFDGKWGIGRNSLLSGFLAKTKTPGIESDDHAYNLRARVLYPRWDLDAGYQEVGEQFNPEVGFLSRRGYRKPDVRMMTRFRPKEFLKLQEIRPHATFRGFWGFDNFQETGYVHLDSHWQFKNSWEVHTGMNVTREGVRTPFQIYPGIFVPPGTYDNQEAQLVWMTNQGAPLSLNLQTFFGGFFSGDRATVNPTLRIRASEAFNMELAYQRNDVNLPQGDFTHQPVAHARVLLLQHPRVPPVAGAVQRPRRHLVDEPAFRMAAGGQHRTVHRLQRQPRPLRPVPGSRGTDRSLADDQVLADVRRPAVARHRR